ncbi:multiubiquitin domain-containing protein [Peijinzhouia sedimentorum]
MSEKKETKPTGEKGKPEFKLSINGKLYEWNHPNITGAEIRSLGNISLEDEIFLENTKPKEDELIPDDKKVNLARPGIERFYSKTKEVIILVNGTQHKWTKEKISFKEVIVLAFGQFIDKPTMVYTVAYEDGPRQNPEGSMFAGQEVFVKNNMIFNATATDKS